MFLKIILILLLLFLLLLLVYKYSNSNINIQESYENYLNCLKKGYSKLFCTENQNYPNLCLCKNGTIGEILPGFKGKCICNKSMHNNKSIHNDKSINNDNNKIYIKNSLSNLDNYFYKRNIYKNYENIIPYSYFGNYSLF
jgi:hypothetical protein